MRNDTNPSEKKNGNNAVPAERKEFESLRKSTYHNLLIFIYGFEFNSEFSRKKST